MTAIITTKTFKIIDPNAIKNIYKQIRILEQNLLKKIINIK